MSRARFAGWFFTLVMLLGFTAGAAWGDNPRLRENDRFSVDVAVANVGIDQFDINREAFGLNPRWCRQRARPRWCIWLDLWWIPREWPDPWPGPVEGFEQRVLIEDLRVGPGLMVAPALEYTFRAEERLRPGLYAGFGVQRDGGQTTDIAGVGSFETEAVTSPVAIYGLALTYDLTPRTAFRFTLGGSTAFMDDMTLRTPNGKVTMEGSNLHSGIVSVGLNFALGGER